MAQIILDDDDEDDNDDGEFSVVFHIAKDGLELLTFLPLSPKPGIAGKHYHALSVLDCKGTLTITSPICATSNPDNIPSKWLRSFTPKHFQESHLLAPKGNLFLLRLGSQFCRWSSNLPVPSANQ